MKIVKQSVKLEQPISGLDILRRIEAAGRTCYQSEALDSLPYAFVERLIRRGHESVLEHVSISVRVVTDRGVSHEIVRHRIGCSYSQESTRYCAYGAGISVVFPAGLSDENAKRWTTAVQVAEKAYTSMLQSGCSAQLARSVLPTCVKTELVITMNLRSWRHFFKLRCAPAAHPQMRELASMILDLFRKEIPIVFDDVTNPPYIRPVADGTAVAI